MIYFILAFAFFIRLLPRLILPKAIADDAYAHCSNADDIRKVNHRIPRYFGKTLFKQVFGYPFFFPYLLSIVPKKYELVVERIISPLFDTLIIYVSSILFADVIGISWEVNGKMSLITFTMLLSVLPGFLRNDTGPRAYNGSARLIGQLFFILTVYSFYYYIRTSYPLWLILSSFFGSLILLSSTFATQAFVLTGIVISFFFPQYLIVLFSALVLFYVLTLGKAHQNIVAQIEHYRWYFKFYQKIHLLKWSHFNNTIGDFIKKWKDLLKLLFKMKLRSFLIYFNNDNNPLHLLLTSYFSFFIIFISTPVTSAETYLLSVCIGVLAAYLLTMHKKLLFLGESYRYLEFGIIYALIFLFREFNDVNLFYYFIWAWIAISLIRYVFFQLDFYRLYKKENENYSLYKEFFSKIQPSISGNVYASIHFRTKAAYFGNFNYLANRAYMNLKYLSLEDNYLAFGNYPNPDGNFKSLIKRFELKYWLTTKSDLEKYLAYTIKYGDIYSMFELVDSDERIDTLLFRIKTDH